MQTINKLENGLTLIVEEMPHLESAAWDLQIPGGIISDPADKAGLCLILSELTSRGAGDMDSRALSEAFENKGIRHSESAGHDRFYYRGSLLAEHLGEALRLLSLMVMQPSMPEPDVDNIRSVLLQDIASLQDSPARRAMLLMTERYYPAPYNRPGIGTAEGLAACSLSAVKEQWQKLYLPAGSVLSVAGNVRAEEVLELARKNFSGWSGEAPKLPEFGLMPERRPYHLDFESAQLQIVVAYPSCRFGEEDYYAAKVHSGILSGGMFGRLFSEVREKRGLCYSVYSRHSATRDYGTTVAYAGTTPDRAHETLTVMLETLRGIKGTVTPDELKRSKANLKASLVIGEESSGSRAVSNAGDWWLTGRVRSLDEIMAEIDRVDLEAIDRYSDRHPARDFAMLTLGSRDLTDIYKSVV